MARILDKAAVQPRSRFNPANAVTIQRARTRLATISIRIPMNSQPNRVDLVATVGVKGVTGIAQILFRIFRDGREIFNTQQGIESAGSEQNYVVTFQAEDRNVRTGTVPPIGKCTTTLMRMAAQAERRRSTRSQLNSYCCSTVHPYPQP